MLQEVQKNPLFRWTILITVVVADFALFQFARDFYRWLYIDLGIEHLFTWGPTNWIIKTLEPYSPIRLWNAYLPLKIIASVLHLLCIFVAVHFTFFDRRLLRMAMIVVFSWLGVGLVLNGVARVLHDAEMLFSARTLAEWMLTPFGLVFTLPALMLYKQQLPKVQKSDKPGGGAKPLQENEVEVTD